MIDTSSKLIADTVAADPNLKKELLSMSIANLLLVNDEIEFVEKFGERLRMRNLEIANAFSAKESSKVLKEKNAEIVILDVMMPQIDGLKLLWKSKINSRWRRSSCFQGRQPLYISLDMQETYHLFNFRHFFWG